MLWGFCTPRLRSLKRSFPLLLLLFFRQVHQEPSPVWAGEKKMVNFCKDTPVISVAAFSCSQSTHGSSDINWATSAGTEMFILLPLHGTTFSTCYSTAFRRECLCHLKLKTLLSTTFTLCYFAWNKVQKESSSSVLLSLMPIACKSLQTFTAFSGNSFLFLWPSTLSPRINSAS